MEEAIKAARQQYIDEHPEAKDIVLKYDPETHITDSKCFCKIFESTFKIT